MKINQVRNGEKQTVDGQFFIEETNITDLSNVVINEGQEAAFFTHNEISQLENFVTSVLEVIQTCKEKLL